MIKKSQLIQMFEGMRTEAQWDVDSDLLWGYFFTDRDKKKLNQLAKKLVSLGYRLVELRPGENDPAFWLHVEKVETHSPDTLHKRNQEFYRMADEYRVHYDGMDVGPVTA
jgi:Regulator of ribonuclease activity B